MAALPAQFVEVSPPSQRRFGLLSVATVVDSSEAHWRSGITWPSPACSIVYQATDPCVALSPKVPGEIAPWAQGQPVVLYAMPQCATVGVDLAKEAVDALVAGEEAALGIATTGLMNMDAALFQETETTPGLALALMEDYLARAGILGAIAVGASTASLLSDRLEQHGNQLTTKLGTPVWVYGGSYMFATGRIVVYRGPASVHGPVQQMPEGNQWLALAERPYVVGYECPQAKVRVTDTDCCAPVTNGGA